MTYDHATPANHGETLTIAKATPPSRPSQNPMRLPRIIADAGRRSLSASRRLVRRRYNRSLGVRLTLTREAFNGTAVFRHVSERRDGFTNSRLVA
jgi:hypothetical protein